MFTVSVKADFTPAQRLLLQTDRQVRTAAARALNRVAEQTKTQASRAISAAYNIAVSKVKERIKIRKAFAAGDLAVEIAVESKFGRRATNLITFGAKQDRRGGVRVKIRRDRPALKGSRWFIITNRRTGGTFVAQRTGKARGDIKSVTTIDVGQMFNARRVNDQLRALIRSKFPAEFQRQLQFARSS